MHRPICCMLSILLICASSGQSQKTAPAGQAKPSTSFTERLLKFLGISDTPGTLKGPGDEVTAGELWLADLQARTTHPLVSSPGYHSPIFLSGNGDVLALRGADVVRIPRAGGGAKKLYSIAGILKLVAASSGDKGTVLILLRGDSGARPRVGLLIVASGAVSPVPYDPASSRDLQMLEDLQGWSRTYGDRRVYVQRRTKQTLSGTVEWSDVFIQVGSQSPVDITQCDGVNCGQPSLSEDGHLLLFVKAEQD